MYSRRARSKPQATQQSARVLNGAIVGGSAGAISCERLRSWSLVARDVYGDDASSIEALARRADWPIEILEECRRRGVAACGCAPGWSLDDCALARVQMLVLGAPGVDADLAMARARAHARREQSSVQSAPVRALPGVLAAASAAAGSANQPHLAALFAAGSVLAGMRRWSQ